MSHEWSRRSFLERVGSALGALGGVAAWGAEPTPTNQQITSMGLVIYCRRIKAARLKTARPPFDLYQPSHFLDECIRSGAGGMQVDLSALSEAAAEAIRERARQSDRFVEAIISLPKDDSDLDRFEHAVRISRRAGAEVARTTIIPGRRYERFKSLEDFRTFERAGEQSVRRAIPVLERHRVKLAIENHKDQRNDERLRLFERIDHEYVGACVDTGNSVALLEDALETVKAFAPWAHSVHLKDQAVQRVPTGFLLADIPLGQGCLDLPAMVQVLQAARPGIHFSLELITRDPLHVPCLTDAYFRLFDDLPARDVARAVSFVERHGAASLPRVSGLSDDEQLARESRNVRESIRYAAENLALRPPPRSP